MSMRISGCEVKASISLTERQREKERALFNWMDRRKVGKLAAIILNFRAGIWRGRKFMNAVPDSF